MLKKNIAVLFLLFCSIASSEETISMKEQVVIDEYVKNVDIQDALGQLFMVGLPADFRTIHDKERESSDRLIGDFGLGMSIVYSHTYYDDNKKGYENSDYLLDVVTYNKKIKKRVEKSKLKLPLLIATDFEGIISPSINPTIKRGVIIPPPSLTLAASQNSDGIHGLGVIVGSELVSLGVDVLLGPVLDTHNVELSSKENNFKKDYMKSRNFSSTIEGVEKTAQPYLEGLKTSGILTFAKHFPSYGAVESNPHDFKEAIYDTSYYSLKNDIKPFIRLNNYIDGIMSSHVSIKDNGENIFSTFSKKIIHQIKMPDLVGKPIITDDLSSMGAIKKYISEHNKSNSDIAILAFDAGHDIFLFSHTKISDKNYNNSSETSIDELFKIKENLYNHILSSEDKIKQFRSSLKKVIYLKFNYLKSKDKNLTVDVFLKGFNDDSINEKETSDFISKVEQKTKNSIAFCKSQMCEPGFAALIVKKIAEKATISINNEDIDFSLLKDNIRDKKVVFSIHESYIDDLKNKLGHNFNSVEYISIPVDKSKIKMQEKKLTEFLKAADFLFYSVFSSTDNDVVERLINLKEKNKYKTKIIIFLHESPSVLTMRVLKNATVVGSFSTHPASFDAILRVLDGSLKPSPIENMPISLGKFHDVANTKWDNYEPKKEQEPKVNYETCVQKDIKIITADNEKYNVISEIKTELDRSNKDLISCKAELEVDYIKKYSKILIDNLYIISFFLFFVLFLMIFFILHLMKKSLSSNNYSGESFVLQIIKELSRVHMFLLSFMLAIISTTTFVLSFPVLLYSIFGCKK